MLTSIKGVTFTVEATDRLTGKMRVDFGESPTPLKEVAKAVMFEVLENHGMMLDNEIKNWAIRVEAKAITLQGRLSTKGLRMLTDLIPFPAETLALGEADEPKAGGAAPGSAGSTSTAESKAATSKKYFQHISLLLDELRTEVKRVPEVEALADGWSTRGRSRSIACRCSTLTRTSSPMAPG